MTESYTIQYFPRGYKRYELTNHLGNLLTVISDKKLMKCPIPDTIASEDFTPDPFVYGQWYNRNSWGRGNSSLHILAGKLIVEDSITSDPHARLNYMLPYDLEPNHTYRVKVDITKNHGSDPWYADIFYSAAQNGYEGTFVRVDTLYDGFNNFTFKVPEYAWRIRFLHHSVAEDIEYGFDNFSIVDITEGEMSYYIADVVAATDYSPFGAPLPERTFTASTNNYRFGFNGQEKDDEVSGIGNSLTAKFWEYDARLGRRWNIDPVDQVNISNYAAFKNNPIIFVDPNGDEVVNGDKIKADKSESDYNAWSDRKNAYMEKHDIGENSNRRTFLKNGGTKSQWKEFKQLKSDVKEARNRMEFWKGRAKVTEEIIEKWKIESSLTFNETNDQKVDFILVSKDLSNTDHGGANLVKFEESEISLVPKGFESYSKPAITVEIDENVSISTIDARTGQYNLNHEAGHFIYIVQNLKEYFAYRQQLRKDNRNYNGGHNDDDKSGQKAKTYGDRK